MSFGLSLGTWAGIAAVGGGGYYLGSKGKKGNGSGLQTQEVQDPLKQAVATPLSKFLASNVGKGATPYPGQVSTPLDPAAKSAYSDFLSLDAGEWYDKAVSQPAWKEFREEGVPLIKEGYAGSLRGSGRFRDVEDATSDFASTLAQGRYQAQREIPQQQFKMGQQLQQIETQQKALEYSEWIRTQPEYSPALDQAVKFLSQSTSSGTDVIAGMNPGQKGWMGDLLKAGATVAAAALI